MDPFMSFLVVQALLRIKYHPAFAARPVIGTPGFAMPQIDRPLIIAVEDGNLPRLHERGITIDGPVGEGSVIVMDEAMPKLDLVCRFAGHADCAAVLGLGDGFAGTLAFGGAHGLFVSAGFGTMGGLSRVSVTLGAFCSAYFGRGVTSVDSHWQVEGEEKAPCAILVGDDAMLADAIWCRNAAPHAIIDVESRSVINAPGHLILGPHCWVDRDVRIGGAVRIGAGSIIGLGAVVTEDLSGRVLACGAPARVLREAVTWDRRRMPTEDQIRVLLTEP